MSRRFGEQTQEELDEARRVATSVIEVYGDFPDKAIWDHFRQNGIWNDDAAVQAALRVIMDRNDAVIPNKAWCWMGDVSDKLESLTCPVLIAAEDLRSIKTQWQAEALEEAKAACEQVAEGQKKLALMHVEVADDGDEYVGDRGIPYTNKALGATHCADDIGCMLNKLRLGEGGE